MKRWRTPKAKNGELRVVWGKLPHDNPDVLFVRGDGVPKRDAALLYCALSAKRVELTVSDEDRSKSHGRPYYFDKSLLEELKERGYDITTLRLSISRSDRNLNKE